MYQAVAGRFSRPLEGAVLLLQGLVLNYDPNTALFRRNSLEPAAKRQVHGVQKHTEPHSRSRPGPVLRSAFESRERGSQWGGLQWLPPLAKKVNPGTPTKSENNRWLSVTRLSAVKTSRSLRCVQPLLPAFTLALRRGFVYFCCEGGRAQGRGRRYFSLAEFRFRL